MTEHLTMNTVIHAAFRRTLARFDAALAAFPDGSQQRAQQLMTAWEFFEEELHRHHDYEERFFWPGLQQTDADLGALDELDGEHDAMRAALERATDAMRVLRTSPDVAAARAGREAVASLGDVLLGHLAHEERDLEPISAAYKDAPSMKAALRRVKKEHFTSMGNTLEWLLDDADPADVVGLRNELPPPVIFLFRRIAGRRYRREIAPTWTTGASVASPVSRSED